MRYILCAMAVVFAPHSGAANPMINDIVDGHILPRFDALADSSHALSKAAMQDCDPTSQQLLDAYGTAFDAWITASHLRFGPTEVDDRAFALAFWPDSRGATPRALTALITDQDPIANDPKSYGDVSIAARGFYALEFLLYDDTFATIGDATYRCTLIQTISTDIAVTSAAIANDWQMRYGDILRNPAPDSTYRNEGEVLQELFKALTTGLQFTSDTRIGRPLGTFDRPRPTQAEAWRSGRSARHVALSLTSLRDLTAQLAVNEPGLAARIDAQFQTALDKLSNLDDLTFANVADPQNRLYVEIVQQSIDLIRANVRDELGPTLGVAAGFNALDGD